MKEIIILITILLFGFSKVSFAQEFNNSIDKDSLFLSILKKVPDGKRDELKKVYHEGNEQTKEFLLIMFSMPQSSKKELIDNYEKKSVEIEKLKTEYSKLVPDSLIVSIEFNPENILVNTPTSLDIKIYSKNTKMWKNDWNITYDSDLLNSKLEIIGWSKSDLNRIKSLLDSANCISISNGDFTTIGFSRSGMGKYFYQIHKHDLSAEEITQINDGCMYIFYDRNVVLEYGSGATGSLCFPDK